MNLYVVLCLSWIMVAIASGAHFKRGEDIPAPPQKYEDQAKREVRGLTVDKRGANAVSQATIFDSNGNTYTPSVEEMCVHGHNFVRGQHKNTPDLSWDASLAADCETYAKQLVKAGNLVHSSGPYGENLYMSRNSYGAVSTTAHAVYSWYSESWDPYPTDGNIKYYNYNFNPADSQEFSAAKVGHFTAAIWKASTSVGCGVATTTFMVDDTTWTRTVVVARYKTTGNILETFPQNVKPLKSGEASLKGQIRVGDLLPGESVCKNTVSPGTCQMYKNAGFCYIVEADCNCQCS